MSTTILSIDQVFIKVNKPFHFSELNFYKEKSENAVKKHHATKSELCEAKKRKQHSNKNKSKLVASLSKSKSNKNDVFEERSRTISCNICISDTMCHHPALLFSESNTSSIEMSYLLRNEQEIFQSIGGFPGDMNNNFTQNNVAQRY